MMSFTGINLSLCCGVISVHFTSLGVWGFVKKKINTTNRERRLLSLTFIKVCIVLCVLREGEAVGDLQPVIDHEAQQDALDNLTPLALFLVMLDNLQHHLPNGQS